MDLGPQSMPSQPSGMPSAWVTILTSWSFLNSWPQAQSHGSTISTPLALAFSSSFGASSAPTLSKRDLPICMPKQTLRNVYAIPPQRMSLSARSMRFSITSTLSLILAPPTMAVSGRCTSAGSSTCENASSSFSTRRPATQGILPAMPTMEECARCAVPNASLTYTSPSFPSDAWNAAVSASDALVFSPLSSTPLPSSSTWKRRFSSRITDPLAGSAHAASTSEPQQSFRNVTGLPSFSPRIFATGASENFSTTQPSGRPKCEARTTDFAPFSRAYLIVGSAPSMR
mmetsp:Transcript_2467/g.6641  ORF Transcript_2467/g.6641 Transcript_2467/m.6641 type:complete len:286 (+) Transcript_2467:292-1149(+)